MTRWSSQLYIKEGRSKDVPRDILRDAARTAELLISPDLPPVFTLRHIAHLTGVPYNFLREVVSRSSDPYRVFKLKKNSPNLVGRYRYICAPHPKLLKVQRWINREILESLQPHEASYAYTKGAGVLKAAEVHSGCRWMIKLDVTNFFESILEPRIYKIFRGLGYQPLVSLELARLCTRVRPYGNPVYRNKQDANLPGLPYMVAEIGHLPQGAATSPLLSNLAVYELDKELSSYSIEHELTYSRYADDMVFSSEAKFSRSAVLVMVHELYDIVRKHGLWPNRVKTKIVSPGARKVVLGLLVDGKKPRLTSEYKQEVRTHLHFLLREDIGVEKHLVKRGFDSRFGLRNFLLGKIAYAQHIEPKWAGEMRNMLHLVKW
ncbi:RNA-directed DNA polymerase [Pseudomonas sp. PDM18]|uniref:reverse transcriptase family protein n=1 Tax=Pseudomonas sp. PDM18 TaxID=2769253 RepID=UPI00177D7E26|nr:reverse transcriptase family protein [Pseudomonas sp. PDM18]MBD9675684.1 RNA-directed DNA polymerase [Pseudomonas sp. PDM18]